MTPLLWLAQHARTLSNLRDRRIVIKVGGSIQDQPDTMRALMAEVGTLALLGARVCVVHGGGKAITGAMSAAGLQARFVGGQRYTDEATLRIAERVLGLTVNAELVGYLHAAGAPARGLHSLGTCVLRARRVAPARPEDDLGLVGEVCDVDEAVLIAMMDHGQVPVIAPVAIDAAAGEHGAAPIGKLNVNADLAAGAVACALEPDTFLLISDTPGVRAADGTYAPRLSHSDVTRLKAEKVIDGGMLPKVRACEIALSAAVRDVRIIDGRTPGSVLAAALDADAGGTRFVP